MKVKYKDFKKFVDPLGKDTETLYNNKYFGLWMNSRHFPELTRDQERFLMKELWAKGSVCAFIVPGTKQEPTLATLQANKSESTLVLENKNQNSGVLALVPYATSQWNIFDQPSIVTYVPKRGATFIPTSPQKVNIDCVIIWAHPTHKPIYSIVEWYIKRIADIERTINVNLFVHKMPRLLVVDPEDEQAVQEVMDAIENGEVKFSISARTWQAIKNVLDGGATYIIDKLHQYKQNVENELMTFLGVNNTQHEKAERLITDEANSNNQLIAEYGDCFKDTIDASCEDVTEVLKFKLTQEVKEPKQEEPKEEEGEEDDNED